jgi:ABC-2 type transport system permease protein
MTETTQTAPNVRRFGRVNGLGLWTLYTKEVRRFLRVGPQTLLAPVVSNLLYMTVFVLAFSEVRGGADPGFVAFLAPGLVMLGILNNASSNSSSSLMTGKMMGSIIDVLMPPLNHVELTLGYIGGSVTRGVLVAFATALGLSLFTPLWPVHLWAVVYFGLSAATLMGMIGILAGIWADKFDQLAVVNQFIILPLSFLSGTFYHIDILPEIFQKLSLGNPLFYLIDGFRYGFIDAADSNIMHGVIFIAVLNIILFTVCLKVFKSGWRLKA